MTDLPSLPPVEAQPLKEAIDQMQRFLRGGDRPEHYNIDLGARVRGWLQLLERAEAIPHPQTWQPIETAPKDGTKILVSAQLKASNHAFVGESSWQGYWFQVDETDLVEVTHWQPLPAPFNAVASLRGGPAPQEPKP